MRRLLVAIALVFGVLLAGCDNTPPPPVPVATDVVPAPVAKPTGLDIPSIGVHATNIVELEQDDDGVMQIPHDAGTTGWFAVSPMPGEPGPAVLAAHVNYNGVPGVFARLAEVEQGDEATVTRADGSTVRFVVYKTAEYPKDAFPTQDVYGNTDGPELRLITCGGELDTAVHSYEDNIVVYARQA